MYLFHVQFTFFYPLTHTSPWMGSENKNQKTKTAKRANAIFFSWRSDLLDHAGHIMAYASPLESGKPGFDARVLSCERPVPHRHGLRTAHHNIYYPYLNASTKILGIGTICKTEGASVRCISFANAFHRAIDREVDRVQKRREQCIQLE